MQPTQNRITQPTKLLDSNGNLTNPGYATEMLFEYNRKDIKANSLRIKEWDYYLIYNSDYGIALTIDDNSYMGLVSASILNFKEKNERTVSLMNWFPRGTTNFPSTSKTGDVKLESGDKYSFVFNNDNGKRHLKVFMKNFDNNKSFDCELDLTNEPKDSMVIATPFDKPKFFYLNQKIVGFNVSGHCKIGDLNIDFKPESTFGILDWGRGVWTYNNMWYWSSACGEIEGVKFGFNLGYGFGDTTKASENMVFYDGIAHKLDRITIDLPKKADGSWDFLNIWKFTSNDNRLNFTFEPILDRAACTNAYVLKSDQHQVFGYFTGIVILDDGREIKVNKFLGFVERVENKW